MEDYRRKILIGRAEIAARVQALGQQITADYSDLTRPLVLISVLKGAIPFTADLMRAIDRPLRLETLVASSYGSGTVSSGEVTLSYRSFDDLTGCDVIVVDDIIDTGHTLVALGQALAAYHPASIAYCVFLSKPERREIATCVDYIGCEVPDRFIIGYGLDFDGSYRELADIYYIDNDGEEE